MAGNIYPALLTGEVESLREALTASQKAGKVSAAAVKRETEARNAAEAAAEALGEAKDRVDAVRPGRYCPPCHPPHRLPAVLELNGIT
jgi:hypothetical protein